MTSFSNHFLSIIRTITVSVNRGCRRVSLTVIEPVSNKERWLRSQSLTQIAAVSMDEKYRTDFTEQIIHSNNLSKQLLHQFKSRLLLTYPKLTGNKFEVN